MSSRPPDELQDGVDEEDLVNLSEVSLFRSLFHNNRSLALISKGRWRFIVRCVPTVCIEMKETLHWTVQCFLLGWSDIPENQSRFDSRFWLFLSLRLEHLHDILVWVIFIAFPVTAIYHITDSCKERSLCYGKEVINCSFPDSFTIWRIRQESRRRDSNLLLRGQ